MAIIHLNQFLGERPLIHPYSLEDFNPQVAQNTKLWSGAIEALEGYAPVRPLTVSTAERMTIFKYNATTWLEWSVPVDVVRSPVANDPYGRVFYTGTGSPRVANAARITSGTPPYPGSSLRLGVPPPANDPPVAVVGTADDEEDDAETRFYVVTYVNAFGEEGPPSPVSARTEVRPGQSVDITLPAAPGGAYEVPTVRIYRSNTAGLVRQFQFVAERAAGSGTFRDSLSSGELGEVLPSEEWDPPPVDLVGLVAMPGGFLAGFRKNEVLFCEPGMPHAWPIRYRVPIGHEVVGLGVTGNTLVVCTKGYPEIFTGVHPAGMAGGRTEIEQSCVSKRGIVTVAGRVIYPSPDGLVAISPQRAEVITRDVFGPDEWPLYSPHTLQAAAWEQLYVAFYEDGRKGFVFNPLHPEAGVVHLDGVANTAGLYSDLEGDTLYAAAGGDIQEWAAGAPMTYTWRSRPYRLPKPTKMGVIQVAADSYPVTARVFAGGELQCELAMTDDRPQRLPDRWLAREYEVEVTGTQRVYDVILTSTMEEMRRI